MKPEMLEMMRDPIGAPLPPVVVQILLILTWALHIMFATLALGSAGLTLYAFLFRKGHAYWEKLGRVAARLTPNSIGLAIVTGIAPLLFVQTIYDPFWYASATLNGTWTVFFIFIMMGAYSLAYFFYLKGSTQGGRYILSAILSFGLLVLAGWIMHVLAATSIRPEYWQKWYVSQGVVDTRGITFRAWNLPRLFFLLPIQAVLSLGVALIFVGSILHRRGDSELAYIEWMAELGRKLALYAAPFYGIAGILWGITEGRALGVGWAVALSTLALSVVLGWYFWQMKKPLQEGMRPIWTWLAVLGAVAVLREVIRAVSVARFGYSVAKYPYRWDWGGILLFAVTTLVGGAVIAFLIRVLYEGSKNKEGQLSPTTIELGDIAVPLLASWFAFFLGLGLYATFLM